MKRIPFELSFLAYALLSVCLIFIVWAIGTSQIGLDGGFYLAITRNLWEDGINYFDFASSYNPLGILLLGIPNLFFENPVQLNYILYFFILILDAVLFYKVCMLYRNNSIQAIFFSSIFLLYTLILDGHLIILEPLQLFFIFLAILQLHKKNYITVGILFFLAFLTKQYSLAFALPIVFFIFQDNASIAKKTLHVIFIVSVALFSATTVYLLFAKQTDFIYFINRLLGHVPQMTDLLSNQNGTGQGYNLSVFVKTSLKVIIYCPLLILPLFTFQRNRTNAFLILSFFSFSSVLIFASYFHYFILLLPWSLILLHQNIEVEKLKYRWALSIVILAPTLLMLVKTARSKNIIAAQEKEISLHLQSTIPKNSNVFIANSNMTQYAHCDFNSIDNHKIGYTFPNVIKKDGVLKALKTGSYLIADENFLSVKERERFMEISRNLDYIIFQKK